MGILQTTCDSIAESLLRKRNESINEDVKETELEKQAKEEFEEDLENQEVIEDSENSEDEEEITEGDSDKEVPINLIINANYQKLVGSKYFFVPDTENDNFEEYSFFVYALTNDGVGDESQGVSDVTKVVKRVTKKFCGDTLKDYSGPDVNRIKTKESDILKFKVTYKVSK
nr:MAG TPA: hypothetical protein [Caudoviricetes sp.]